MVTAAIWPALDYSRVPYRLYHDAEVYAREQERIFRGPVWNFLGARGRDPQSRRFPRHLGRRHAGHRQSRQGRRRSRPSSTAAPIAARWCGARSAGNAAEHICIYHQWCYGLDGGLTAIPFRRGIRGKGGMGPDFDMGAHGLRPLRVDSVNGALFGTLGGGCRAARRLSRRRRSWRSCAALLDRPVRVLGYNRQRIRGNWKLYAENTRDNYHASLLHEFLVTFGLDRVDPGRRRQDGSAAPPQHHLGRSRQRHRRAGARRPMPSARVRNDYLSLKEPDLVAFRPRARRPAQPRGHLGLPVFGLRADQQQPGGAPDQAARRRRGRSLPDDARL